MKKERSGLFFIGDYLCFNFFIFSIFFRTYPISYILFDLSLISNFIIESLTLIRNKTIFIIGLVVM